MMFILKNICITIFTNTPPLCTPMDSVKWEQQYMHYTYYIISITKLLCNSAVRSLIMPLLNKKGQKLSIRT